MKYEREEIKKKVNIAIDILFKNDSFLLKYDVNERSISHKLAEYIQIQFPEWHVDCEYNKKMFDTKKMLKGIKGCSKQKKTDKIYPDIIVHMRATNDNLLVIETKKGEEDDPCDIRKLGLFTEKGGEYVYEWGLFTKFLKNEKPSLTWFKDRKKYEPAD
jgi:hypothetical protein